MSYKILPYAFLLSFLMIGSLSAQNLKYDRSHFEQYPDYHEVVRNFYTGSLANAFKPEEYLKFEKRIDGWYLAKYYYADLKFRERQKIWDAQSKKYLFELNKTSLTSQGQQALAQKELDYYLCPVYGYDDDPNDNIQLLSQLPLNQLNSEELEALARAYEDLAYKNLGERHFASNTQYDSTLKASDIPAEVLETAEKNALLSLKVLNLLLKKYPEHPSIIGDPQQFYSNAAMFHYLQFKAFQQDKIAEQFLEKVKYSKAYLSYIKNLLNSCPNNSILFTYGDNDSYGCWYLQLKKGFRTDIAVIHSGLLAVGRLTHFFTKLMKTNQLPQLGLDLDPYLLRRNNYFLINAEDSSSLEEFLDKVAAQKTYTLAPTIKFPKKFSLQKGALQLNLEYRGNYILKNDWITLDLIQSNWHKRPICFSFQREQAAYRSLMPYLRKRGLVTILTTERFGDGTPGRIPIQYKETQELFLKKFEWPSLPKEKVTLSKYQPFLVSIQNILMETALQNMIEGDSLRAKKLLQLYQTADLCAAVRAAELNLYTAQYAMDLKMIGLRDHVLQLFLEQIEEDFKQLKQAPKTAYERCFPSYLSEESLHLEINKVINFCRLQDWDDWVKKYQKSFNH